MEVHRLCRLCLTHSSYHSNIFVDSVSDKQLHHLINSICELNAFRNDGLPEYICVDCFQNITRTFSFINQAKEATSALKLMVDRNKSMNSLVVAVEISPEESQSEDVGTEESEGDDIQFLSEDSHQRRVGKDLRPFVCQLCGVDYTRKDHLVRHKVAKHELRFRCTICGIELSTKVRLKRHVEAHRGLRPYTCHLCQFGFKKITQLKKHKQKGCFDSKVTRQAQVESI